MAFVIPVPEVWQHSVQVVFDDSSSPDHQNQSGMYGPPVQFFQNDLASSTEEHSHMFLRFSFMAYALAVFRSDCLSSSYLSLYFSGRFSWDYSQMYLLFLSRSRLSDRDSSLRTSSRAIFMCFNMWNLSNTILESASSMCDLVHAMYRSHMSIETAHILGEFSSLHFQSIGQAILPFDQKLWNQLPCCHDCIWEWDNDDLYRRTSRLSQPSKVGYLSREASLHSSKHDSMNLEPWNS